MDKRNEFSINGTSIMRRTLNPEVSEERQEELRERRRLVLRGMLDASQAYHHPRTNSVVSRAKAAIRKIAQPKEDKRLEQEYKMAKRELRNVERQIDYELYGIVEDVYDK